MKADKEGEGVKASKIRIEAALFSLKERGGRVTETENRKNTENLWNRLYLGTPRCGDLV